MKVRKKVEKKRVKPVASEGDAVAGKGRFGRDMVRKLGRDGRDPTRPCPWDGRADCLRFASPAEAD